MIKKLVIGCLGVLAIGCTQVQKQNESVKSDFWPRSAVAYEIFVRSFVDSDGDSIGDINGMKSKLPYLDELGVDAIWLMPIMPSPTYHKYDVTNYKAIDPEYGTMDDFKAFLKQAHDRNIKVIIDMVINHTSSEHPWFLNAKLDSKSKFRNYYLWADKDSVAAQIAKKEIAFDSDNIRQWHPVDGDTTAKHYYGYFWGGMPDLNYDNPEVKKVMFDIGKYWLTEVGVDGFRLDAARHIFPTDRAQDNHKFWEEYKSEMEKVKPDVYLVGEVWDNTETQAPYTAGFNALFDFDLTYSILESVENEKVLSTSIEGSGYTVDSTHSFIDNLNDSKKAFYQYNPEYIDAIFLSNHDQNRYASVLKQKDKIRLAASILFTLPGTPYLYYGEEIGMLGKKPDPNIREPFLWDKQAADTLRPRWITPKFTTDQTVSPLSQQLDDRASLYHHYKSLIDLRKAHPALVAPSIDKVESKNREILAYERKDPQEKLLVIHNLSHRRLKSDMLRNYQVEEVLLGQSMVKGSQLELMPFSSFVAVIP